MRKLPVLFDTHTHTRKFVAGLYLCRATHCRDAMDMFERQGTAMTSIGFMWICRNTCGIPQIMVIKNWEADDTP